MNLKNHVSFAKEILFLLGESKRKLPLFALLFLVASVLDLLGIGLIAPYVALLSNRDASSSRVYSWLESVGISTASKDLLVSAGLLLLSIFVIKSICAVFVNKAIYTFSFEQGAKLRIRLMHAYQNMPYAQYLERNSSEYVYHIQQLASNYSQGFLQSILRLWSEGIVVITIMAFLAWKNWVVLVFMALLLGSAMIIYDRFFKHKLSTYGRLYNHHNTTMLQAVHEGIEGLKEIRILGKEDLFIRTVTARALESAGLNVKMSMIGNAPRQLSELVLVAFAVLLVLSSLALGQDPTSLLPTLSVFGVAAIRLVPSANAILLALTNIRFDRNSISLIYFDLVNILRQKTSIRDRSTSEKVSFTSVELDRVVFAYPTANRVALNEVSLRIEAGDCVGLIGSSGAGKTTLVDVLLGLLEPQQGHVLFNGVPLNENFSELRDQVAYLPQQAFLIDSTLRQNIALGIEDHLIDEAQLSKAIEQAQLTDLVASLPQGVRTVIGERGVQLSGGQRQRVALARSFYYSRSLLVMDESTSALDSDTENEVLQQMTHLKGVKTMIVIAHRLTTLQHCDRIYRIDNGKVVEQCSYDELIQNENRFARAEVSAEPAGAGIGSLN